MANKEEENKYALLIMISDSIRLQELTTALHEQICVFAKRYNIELNACPTEITGQFVNTI